PRRLLGSQGKRLRRQGAEDHRAPAQAGRRRAARAGSDPGNLHARARHAAGLSRAESLPGLTRQSISLAKHFMRSGWTRGSSRRVTAVLGVALSQIERRKLQRSEAVRCRNVLVAMNTTALPLKRSGLAPRFGSVPKFMTTADVGLIRNVLKLL